jgi:tRNA G10  N-methylase Trm11
VIDPFCGFGGRLVAASMLDIEYRGMDINDNLQPLYTKMIHDLVNENNKKKE